MINVMQLRKKDEVSIGVETMEQEIVKVFNEQHEQIGTATSGSA